MYVALNLHIDFSKEETVQRLNGMFMFDEVRGMLEENDYRSLNMVFPFFRCLYGQGLWNVRESYADDSAFPVLISVA